MKTTRSLLAFALVLCATSTAHAQPAPPPPPAQPAPSQPAPPQPAPPAQAVAASPAQTPPPVQAPLPVLPQPGAAPSPTPMQPGASSPPPAPYVGPNGYPAPYGPPGMVDELVVMPPGFLERPGRFPRIVPITDRRAPIPVGYRLGREPRKPLWIAGTAIFASSHALTGLTAGGLLADNPDEGEYGLLFLPVIGPVVWSGVAYGLDDEDARTLFAGMSLVTAIQGVGFGLMLAGFSFPRRVYVRNDVASASASSPTDAEGPSLTFSIRPGGVGLAVDF